MPKYEIALTITDVVDIEAETEEQAYELAEEVFKQGGYDLSRPFELDIISYGEDA